MNYVVQTIKGTTQDSLNNQSTIKIHSVKLKENLYVGFCIESTPEEAINHSVIYKECMDASIDMFFVPEEKELFNGECEKQSVTYLNLQSNQSDSLKGSAHKSDCFCLTYEYLKKIYSNILENKPINSHVVSFLNSSFENSKKKQVNPEDSNKVKSVEFVIENCLF